MGKKHIKNYPHIYRVYRIGSLFLALFLALFLVWFLFLAERHGEVPPHGEGLAEVHPMAAHLYAWVRAALEYAAWIAIHRQKQ